MNIEKYVGKWGTCNFDDLSVPNEDIVKLDNYPFKGQLHKCIGFKSG